MERVRSDLADRPGSPRKRCGAISGSAAPCECRMWRTGGPCGGPLRTPQALRATRPRPVPTLISADVAELILGIFPLNNALREQLATPSSPIPSPPYELTFIRSLTSIGRHADQSTPPVAFVDRPSHRSAGRPRRQANRPSPRRFQPHHPEQCPRDRSNCAL